MSIRIGGRIGPLSISTGLGSGSQAGQAGSDGYDLDLGVIMHDIEIGRSDAELLAVLQVHGKMDRGQAKMVLRRAHEEIAADRAREVEVARLTAIEEQRAEVEAERAAEREAVKAAKAERRDEAKAQKAVGRDARRAEQLRPVQQYLDDAIAMAAEGASRREISYYLGGQGISLRQRVAVMEELKKRLQG